MMKEMKLAIRLMKYAPGKKNLLISGVLFTLLGIIDGFVVESIMTNVLGIFIFMILFFLVIQMFQYMQYFEVVAASEKNFWLQTKCNTILSMLCGLTAYLVTMLCYGIQYARGVFPSKIMGNLCVWTAVLSLGFVWYIIIAAKYMVISTILYMLALLVSFEFIRETIMGGIATCGVMFGVVAGFLILAVGTPITYLITRLLYNKPNDPKMLGAFISLKM